MADDEVREENVADIDFSQIRTAIQLGGRMIEQILNGVHYGSPEVRCLLLDECDIILECKVCRGLFRALPNFVAHKRVYCKQAFIISQQNLFSTLPEEDVVVVHPCAPEEAMKVSSDKSADEKVKSTLIQVADGKLGRSEMYKFYSKAADKIDQQKKSRKSLDVVLSKITSNPHAVKVTYHEHTQTQEKKKQISNSNEQNNSDREKVTEDYFSVAENKSKSSTNLDSADNVFESEGKTDINEIQSLSHIPGTKDDLGICKRSEGEKVANQNSEVFQDYCETSNVAHLNSSDRSTSVENSLLCHQCNTKYSSRKTLLYHFQVRHSGLRTFFPCPICSNVFFYFWGLTRHLRVNHKKTPNQINKMRKALRGTAFTKNVTKPCIQAKDQLAFTSEMDTPFLEVKHETSKLKDKTSITEMIRSKAIVKHTSKNAKHTFACRYVPKNEDNAVIPLHTNRQIEEKPKDHRRYIYQLVCESCQKVFWKKARLTNHRKFCSLSRKTATANINRTSQKQSCSCGKTFLKMKNFQKHIFYCKKGNKVSKTTSEQLMQNKSNSAVEFECSWCQRSFEKKISLENHKRSCLKTKVGQPKSSKKDGSEVDFEKQTRRSSHLHSHHRENRHGLSSGFNCKRKKGHQNQVGKKNSIFKEDIRIVEEIWINKKPGQPSQKVKSSRVYLVNNESSGLQTQDRRKLAAIVDESTLKCKKCAQTFTDVCNLCCHAFRHLDWKRYKCKLCYFSSYNIFDCNAHVTRTHSESCHDLASTGRFIVDLNMEAAKFLTQKKIQSDPDAKLALDNLRKNETSCGSASPKSKSSKINTRDFNTADQMNIREVDHSRKFNISTRNSPRKFDTRPYQKLDSMSTLFTRKGYYPKLEYQFMKKNESNKITEDSLNVAGVPAQQSEIPQVTSGDKVSSKKSYFGKDLGSPSSECLKSEEGRREKMRKKTRVLPKFGKSEESECQLPKMQSAILDSKSSDLRAPWPRSPEPMSVKEMFALIRRSPRTGNIGVGRRKSVGDLPVSKHSEQSFQMDETKHIQQTSETERTQDTKNNLGATITRKSLLSGSNLSLSLRTSRPGVDWSQNMELQSKGQTKIIDLFSEKR